MDSIRSATHDCPMKLDMSGTSPSRTPRGVREDSSDLSPADANSAAIGGVTPAEAARVAEVLEAARAPATRRAYASAWNRFSRWCVDREVEPLGVNPELVAVYLASIAEQGGAMSTIDRASAAIRAVHRDAGVADPTAHPGVERVRAGLRRTVGIAPRRQAHPLSTAEIRRIVEHIDDDIRGRRDRALILVGYAGALRRSELSALAVGDVEFRTGGVVLRLRCSKTDQERAGAVVGIARGAHPVTCPVTALRRWLDVIDHDDVTVPLYRPVAWSARRALPRGLDGRDVARILQSRAEAAGLGDLPISGHSLRAGHATEAAARGVPADRLARTTRHASIEALARYVRPAQVLADTSSKDLGL